MKIILNTLITILLTSILCTTVKATDNNACKLVTKNVSDKFYACFAKIKKDKTLKGIVTVAINIDENGIAHVLETNASSKELEKIVMQTIEKMKVCQDAKGEQIILKVYFE